MTGPQPKMIVFPDTTRSRPLDSFYSRVNTIGSLVNPPCGKTFFSELIKVGSFAVSSAPHGTNPLEPPMRFFIRHSLF